MAGEIHFSSPGVLRWELHNSGKGGNGKERKGTLLSRKSTHKPAGNHPLMWLTGPIGTSVHLNATAPTSSLNAPQPYSTPLNAPQPYSPHLLNAPQPNSTPLSAPQRYSPHLLLLCHGLLVLAPE